jgi:hypothetical protein
VVSWVIATGLITYIKVSIASVFRLEGGRALFWCGAVQQAGSAIGALLFFFIINYTDTFTSYSPCEWHIGTQFYIGFEVLTALIMKSPIFWDIMPCSLLKIHPYVARTCHLDLQARRISYGRNQHEAGSSAGCRFLTWLILQLWNWRQHVPLKYHLTFRAWRSDVSKTIDCFSILWFNLSDWLLWLYWIPVILRGFFKGETHYCSFWAVKCG